MRTRPLALVALIAAALLELACTVAPPEGSPTTDPAARAAGGSAESGNAGDAGSTTGAPSSATTDPGVTVLATVPSGLQCLVATVTGADSETVSAPVPFGTSSVTLSFGALAPGAITVSADAYTTACPPTGAPAWVSEPAQATVVVGVATQIQLVLHPASQGATGTATFSLPAVAIAAGGSTSYAVLSDGTARAWGNNAQGEFGATTPASSSTPVVVPGVTNAVQIAAGDDFACVLRSDSSVMCWGYNANSFLTPTVTTNTISPPVLSPGLSATQISALGTETVVVGAGTNPPIGIIGIPGVVGITWNPLSQTPVNPISIAADWANPTGVPPAGMCWVDEGGNASCNWGTGASSSGMQTVNYAQGATHVFAGTETAPFGCAVIANGSVVCWGANDFGELGTGSTSSSVSPTTVPGLHGVTTMALSYSVTTAVACAVAAGSVLCSGSNQYGQLGNGTAVQATSFAPVVGLGSSVVALATGYDHTCALDNEGFVHCWGLNAVGQVGDGTTISRFEPVSVQPW